jgi:dGTPase
MCFMATRVDTATSAGSDEGSTRGTHGTERGARGDERATRGTERGTHGTERAAHGTERGARIYRKVSPALQKQIEQDRAAHRALPYRTDDAEVLRRDPTRDRANLWRPAFVRDVEKILHSVYYNRYADKTQVFSFQKNDDITRRALHVQLVSRAARTIGAALGLNNDLIEAIALGHDIGHTPFGHAGERYLDELYHAHTGRHFSHNVHSVRVLDGIFDYNLSLQTLDGILCHNGEFGLHAYAPPPLGDFASFDAIVEECYTQPRRTASLVAATLEGCVVRICDMIAYVGKDRQDVQRIAGWESAPQYADRRIGTSNASIINNLTVDIIEHSYGRGELAISEDVWRELETIKRENYALIYGNPGITRFNDEVVRPMFGELYEHLLADVISGDGDRLIWRHHIRFVQRHRSYLGSEVDYAQTTEPNQIVVDYLASMTDDYFVDLYCQLFPERPCLVEYSSYFKDAPQLRLEL